MINCRKIAVIGGLPEPVGGVTNFISRLASLNMINEIIDIYPSRKKLIPKGFNGELVFLKSKISLPRLIFLKSLKNINYFFHFNFSTTHSLPIFCFIPKLSSRWGLMLHHGDLSPFTSPKLIALVLSRFDVIFALSKSQHDFYVSMGVSAEKIITTSSYVSPLLDEPTGEMFSYIDDFFSGHQTFVASGYPSKIYNHLWCINYVSSRPNYRLALFLYGNGECVEELMNAARCCDRIKIYFECDQNVFNYALSKAVAYLRPTSVDSFGIAVADAVNMGIPAIASNVCRRHPGTLVLNIDSYESFTIAVDKYMSGDRIGTVEEVGDFRAFSYEI